MPLKPKAGASDPKPDQPSPDSETNPPEDDIKRPENAFTDAPDLHPNLFLGSLHLIFWFIFHPSAWRNYVTRLEPGLDPDFTLTELSRRQWSSSKLRRFLIQVYILWPLPVGLTVALILWLKGVPDADIIVPVFFVMSINLTLALMIGAVVSVLAGVVTGTAVATAVGVASSLTSGYGYEVVVPTAIGLAVGVGAGIGNSVVKPVPPRSPTRQFGAIVIGVAVGVLVVSAIRFGLTTLAGLVFVLPGDTGYNVARILVVGTSYGVAIGWRRGLGIGLGGGLLCSLAYALAITGWKNEWQGVAIGLTSGLLFGTSFGVTVVLPYVLADWIAGPWAGAWAGALGSWGRHVVRNNAPLWPAGPLGLIAIALGLTLNLWLSILLYPLWAAWNLILFQLDERNPDRLPRLLRKHSAFWDEHQRLKLRGLDEHLLLVMDRAPAEGEAALAYLRSGRQRWAAQAVQIELEIRRLERCEDLSSISRIHVGLSSVEPASPAGTLFRSFSHVSQDVEAALHQTTAYHQRLALSAVEDRLNSLDRELSASTQPFAGRFYPVAVGWSQLVNDHLRELAEAVEQSQEIENPYIVGVPLTEQHDIFVGRTDIVARIEQLLLDQRRPPLLLYGQRRMGKTSLLRNLGRLLPKTIVPLFVDGQKVALATDYPDFLYNVSREMVKSAGRQRGLTLSPLSRLDLADNPFTSFDEWLDQVEQDLDRHNCAIALLAMDEFETLGTVSDKGRFELTDVLNMLRHLIQHRPHFKVMLAGSHAFEEFQNWSSYLINVQVMKISYLEQDEVYQLIEQPVRGFALKYDLEARERVLALTRGHPALVQLLCYEIITLKNEQNPASRRLTQRADVEEAVQRALMSGSFFFADIQQNQINEVGLVVLRFMAKGGEGAVVDEDTLSRHCNCSADELAETLKLLSRRDLIETVDGCFRFQVEMIRRWFERSG